MPPALCSTTNLSHVDVDVAPATVRRSAFYLTSQGEPLFAWLHHGDQVLNHGILLCAPWGHEQVHSHRAWRFLADALAAAGFPVLRLDYHGTGDSGGVDEDPDRVKTWLANLRDGHEWLKQAGLTKVSFVGLRLGATLAMHASAMINIDSLVLWAPVVSGRHHVREIKALGLTAAWKAPLLPEAPHDVEAGGFVLTKNTADELSKLDVLKVQPRCRRALVIGRDDAPTDSRLFDHLTALGIPTEQITQPGYLEMMAEPHQTKVPHQAIACAVDWFRVGATESARRAWRPENTQPDHARIVHAGTSIRERMLTFAQGRLFGILTEPMEPSDRPLILWLNSGTSYRPGPSRLNALAARQLAGHGFRTLRFDLAGVGDSVPPGGEGTIDCYHESAFRDIEIALELARTELGATRVVLAGLCSGAYFAFQCAVQMAGPLLVESIILNPLTFFWKDGMTLETGVTKDDLEFNYYQHSAFQPSKWLRLLTGRSKIGIRGAIAKLWNHWRHRPQRDAASASVHEGPVQHPKRDDLAGDLERLARRGRKLTCFFAKAEPGLAIMKRRASQEVSTLQQTGVLSVTVIEDADHTFSSRVPRLAILRALTEHLGQRYGNHQ